MKVEMIDAKIWHVGQMARFMRAEHHAALLSLGVSVHWGLRNAFFNSYYRRAAFLDGHLAALWGIMGSYVHFSGCLWLTLTDHAARHPLLVARYAKAELAEMMKGKMLLETTVIPGDRAAQRFAAFLGFRTGEPPIGHAVSTRGRKVAARQMAEDSELIGTHGQVEVYYRPEAAHGVE